MPSQRSRSVYPVTSALIVVLALMFATGRALREFVPPPPPNGLVPAGEDYLEAGSRQEIPWMAMGPNVLAEARRLDRPVFLLIGDQSNRHAREADHFAFRDPELTAVLRQAFVCVRVDASQYPEWVSAYLPLSRLPLGLDPLFQVWILDPRGEILGSVLVRGPVPRVSSHFMLPGIRDALARWAARADPANRERGSPQQHQDRARIALDRPPTPISPEQHRAWLARSMDRAHGGWPYLGFQTLRPNAYRFLLEVGDHDSFRFSLDPVLRTPVVDWLDGGFFYRSREADWTRLDFDKFATHSAEMMATLAKASVLLDSTLYRRIAVDTFDALSESFVDGGLPASYRVGDERPDGRSHRSSFSVRELRDNLSPESRRLARALLGLRVETNPQMVPSLPDSNSVHESVDALQEMLRQLRGIKARHKVVYGGAQQMDTAGVTIARLLETARILDDIPRLARAQRLFDRLYRLRIGQSEVMHSLRPTGRSHRYLGDYLAFADAALEDYLASGRVVSARDGLQVLMRGLEVFRGPVSGSLVDGLQSRSETAFPNVPSERLADDVAESSIARAMRLSQAYSCLFRSLDPTVEFAAEGLELRQVVAAMLLRYVPVVNELSESGLGEDGFRANLSGFFAAAQFAREDVFALCTGPRALELSRELVRLVPTRLVAPAFGPIRPVLQGKGDGVFVVRDGVPEGPLSVRDAAERLRTLRPLGPGI